MHDLKRIVEGSDTPAGVCANLPAHVVDLRLSLSSCGSEIG